MTEIVTEKVGGLRVAKAESRGPSEGPPLLFVHGMWDGSWIWRNYLDFFPVRGHACYALDLRGRAGSWPVPDVGKVRFREYVEDARAVARGLGNPVLVGHSAGGLIVQKLAEVLDPPAVVALVPAAPRGIFALATRELLAAALPPETSSRVIADSWHSNFPVCEGNLDKVLGIVSVKNPWLQATEESKPDLQAALHPAPLVPENMPAFKVLEVFRESGSQVALVIDEYGGIQGVITPIDVLEATVGAIPSPDEPPEPQAMRFDDGSWLFDGALSADILRDTFGLRRLPEEERGDYFTVGDFVMMHMRRIPQEGERFEWGGLSFEVADMDGSRVNDVFVVPVPKETGKDSPL